MPTELNMRLLIDHILTQHSKKKKISYGISGKNRCKVFKYNLYSPFF